MTTAAYFILGYLALLTLLGLSHARRVQTGADFALAGRRLGVGVTAGTLIATWIGTGSLYGSPEFTVKYGVAAFLYPIGGVLGILALGSLGARARDIPEAMSVPQILGVRFGRVAQLIAALALVSAYMIIASYQFRAGAHVAKLLFPAASQWSLPLAFATFVVLYTVLAGMVSVAWTDLINGMLMTVGILTGLAWAAAHWNPATQPIPVAMRDLGGGLSTVTWIGYLLPAFLLVLGDANLFQRFMSTGSPRTARWAAFWMFWGVLVLEYAIIALALIGWLLLPEKPSNPAHTILAMTTTVFPLWLGIVIQAAAAAVIITTADSILLSASTSVSVDLLGGPAKPGKQRAIVVALGGVALALSYASDKFFSLALYAYTLYGASLTPALVCALLFPAIPRAGIVGGMAAGLVTALSWKALLVGQLLPEALVQWEPVLPALMANLITIVGISWIVSRPWQQ